METGRVDKLSEEFKSFSRKEKVLFYSKNFSLGYIDNMDDKFILISLVSLTYLKLNKKSPITPLEVLLKITKAEEGTYFYEFLENLAIIVEDFSYGLTTASNCGLKSSEEIINKIKELLSKWIPF